MARAEGQTLNCQSCQGFRLKRFDSCGDSFVHFARVADRHRRLVLRNVQSGDDLLLTDGGASELFLVFERLIELFG